MLNNLTGWHVIIVLGMLVTVVLVIVVIVGLVSRMSRTASPVTAAASPDAVEQIRKLGELRDDGLITQAEYDQKRSELRGRI